MCELLGMSANTPTDLCFSFTGLTQRGGNTGPHADGWGVVFFEGKGIRTFHDSAASCASEVANLVQKLPIKSHTAICHIRQANVGGTSLSNTHPFVRELWGNNWVFAHNGQVKGFSATKGIYEAIGDTDSENIFCDLMNQIRQGLSRDADQNEFYALLTKLAQSYATQGVFNCLLSNGDWLFSFCSTKLASITRRAPFGPAQLTDADLTVDFAGETTPNDIVSIIATEPLTSDERWYTYEPGEWRVWRLGEVVASGKVSL